MSRRVRCRRCPPGRRPAAATSNLRRAISMMRPTASAPRRCGVSPEPKAKASRSATSKATGTGSTKICRAVSRCSAARRSTISDGEITERRCWARWFRYPTQGLRRHQPSGQGRGPFRGHQRRLQHRRRDQQCRGQLKKGDVMLIELQATGPNGKYVAMQYLVRHLYRDQGGGRQGHHGCRGGRQRQTRTSSGGLQQIPACRRTAARSSSAQACRRPITWISTASAQAALLRFARRSALAHLLFQLRQDRQRPGMGLARDHARLWRCPRRSFGEYLVHAAFFRHIERFADRHRRGGVPAGASQSQERRAYDPQKGEGYIDVDGNAAAGGPRRSA